MIHIELVDMHGTAPYKDEDKKVTVASLKFEKAEEALNWWNALRKVSMLYEKDVESVIKDTVDTYVGVEAELMTCNGQYTSWILCIEGRETS